MAALLNRALTVEWEDFSSKPCLYRLCRPQLKDTLLLLQFPITRQLTPRRTGGLAPWWKTESRGTCMWRMLNWRASLNLNNRMKHINENVKKPVRNHLRARYNGVWVLAAVSILIEKTWHPMPPSTTCQNIRGEQRVTPPYRLGFYK